MDPLLRMRRLYLTSLLIIIGSALAFALAGTAGAAPDPQRVRWVRQHAIPLATATPGSGFDDLRPLKRLIGKARVVALGEPTHGSREVFQMKHRLLEYLASELGFAVFAIEANAPESERMNDYVLRGQGKPEDFLRGMYFWTWQTEEVAEMCRWMRQFNESGRGPLSFAGFDMQFADTAMAEVVRFVGRVDPGRQEGVAASYRRVRGGLGGGTAFGVATGTFPVAAAKGKKLRYSAWIRTEDVRNGWGGLWWRCDSPDRRAHAFDNMQSTGPRGTTDWQHYSVTLEIPEETTNINFGMIQPGTGRTWFDGVTIELDGVAYADESFDLDFESGSIRGFWTPSAGTYRASVDDSVAKVGKRSLRIESVGSPKEAIETASAAATLADSVMQGLVAAKDAYAAASSDREADWAIQNARVVLQRARMEANQTRRDESMAENVKWILSRAPQGRGIVLWAHNSHVSRWKDWMGGYLDRDLGADQFVIGFSTREGEYTAVPAKGGKLGVHQLELPGEGSFESAAHATGLPILMVDLRRASKSEPASSWLTEPVLFGGGIGAMQVDSRFKPMNLHEGFDAIIHIDHTTASRPLPGPGKN